LGLVIFHYFQRIALFALALTLFLIAHLAGQEIEPSDFKPQFKPSLTIHKTTQPIVIDGNLNDPGWNNAATATSFSEFSPGDNVRPMDPTRVLVTYDKSNLYVAFIAESDPNQIRVSMTDRDVPFQDDYLGIVIDTYGNSTWGYEIFANPYGIQMDGKLLSNGDDMSFNMVFQSKGKITDSGYQVEFAIPFRSLRFPDAPNPVWRITFYRNQPRDSRHEYSWAAIDRDNPCLLCQLGYLRGLQGITSGHNIELLPEGNLSQRSFLTDEDDPNSTFKTRPVKASASLGLKYGLTSTSTFDLTINPDFSQVEADPAQIDVNSTFALSYPERRPFFQEGNNLFDTWMDLVYTRSINDPSVAAKFTGRFHQTDIAYIGAKDERTPIILPFEEQSEFVGDEHRIRSYSNILRVMQYFGEESHIGLLLTDRRLDHGGSGTVISADSRIRFSQNDRLELQVAASQTVEPNDTLLSSGIDNIRFGEKNYSSIFDGEKFWGYSALASFEHQARIWYYDLSYQSNSPTFRAANGFITGNNFQYAEYNSGWVFRPNTKIFDRIEPGFEVGYKWNFEQIRKDKWAVTYLSATLTRQTQINLHYILSRERFQSTDFPGIHRIEFNVNSQLSEAFSAGISLETGRSIARNEDPPLLGKSFQAGAWSTIKPAEQLSIEPEIDYSQMIHPVNDTTIYAGYVFRTRISYQFTRRFFIRLFIQYDDFNRNYDIDPLLTYRINAFSVIYLGATHNYHNFRTPVNNKLTSRQYFFKFRYLFQL